MGGLTIGNRPVNGDVMVGLNKSPGGKDAPAADSGVAEMRLCTLWLAVGFAACPGEVASMPGLVEDLLLV